jgi:hypothetical protein
VVQPLPIAGLSAEADGENKKITLRWTPRLDIAEPTAEPKGYVIYTKKADGDFDNGQYISGENFFYQLNAEPGILYSFRIAAVNEGGASLLSEEVCAAISNDTNAPSILLVDAFQRLAGPQPFDNEATGGFGR